MVEDAKRFRITVLAPLLPRPEYATSGTLGPRSLRLEGGSFDGLMANIGTSVKIQVPDPLGAAGDSLRVDLSFRDLRSFRPDGLGSEVPVLRSLLAARGVVADIARRGLGRADAQRELEGALGRPAWAKTIAELLPNQGNTSTAAPGSPTTGSTNVGSPSTPSTKPAAVPSLLDEIELAPQVDPGATKRAFSSIISQVARSGSPSAGQGGGAAARLERAFTSVLFAILDHPEVRRLERAFRGLRFLAGEAGPHVAIDVVPFDRSAITEALAHIVSEAADSESAPDLLLLDLETALDPFDAQIVATAGEVAERLRAALVVSGAATLLELDDTRDRQIAALAREPWAAWCAIATNGALVRGPYTPETARVREVKLTQPTNDAGAKVFASAAYVLASLCIRSFKEIGWASAVTGPESGTMGGFEVYAPSPNASALSTEKLVGPEAAQKHARRGLVTFTSVPNRDSVACGAAPTLARAAGDAPSLGDQLFVSRLVAAVLQVGAAIPAGTDPRTAAQVATIALSDLFPTGGMRAPTFSAVVDDATLSVTVQPHRFAGTTVGELVLDAPLGD